MKAYAIRHGRQEEISQLSPSSPIVGFDTDQKFLLYLPNLIVIGGGLIYNQVFIGVISRSVHKTIVASKRSMSKETYKMQRTLTVILVLQVRFLF